VFEQYLACADLHITDKTPRYRKDDYLETGLRKLEWIVNKANDLDAVLLLSGDVFDSVTIKWEVVNRVTAILQNCRYTPIAIAGQHDMVNKVADLLNTPLFNLAVNGVIEVIGTSTNGSTVGQRTGIQGQQYHGPMPVPEGENNIILIHKSITPEEPPFFLGDALSAEDAVKLYRGFRVIVAGDYHLPFHVKIDGIDVVNCGPMMRDKKDKRELKPCVWHIGKRFEDVKVTKIEIPIEPADAVFDIAAIEYDETNTVSVDTAKLKQLIEEGIDVFDFDAIVHKVYESTDFKFITKEDVTTILTGA